MRERASHDLWASVWSKRARARAYRPRAKGCATHPTCLASSGGADPRRLADHSLLPASQGGGRRLLRLPSSSLRADWGSWWETPPARACPAALVMSTTCGMLRLAAQSLLLLTGGDAPTSQRDALSPASRPTCSSPASTPSSTLRAVASSYANAGHDLPYLRRSGDAEELRARGMPLGTHAGDGL